MTDPDERALAYRIFSEAIELEGGARAPYLDRACAHAPALRAEVEALLAAALHDRSATTAFLALPPAGQEDLAGSQFGRFRLIERIGEGGMGVVYRAERTDGVKQSVALKLISSAVGSPGQARFEREAQLLARLEHPAVARLIDAGVESGRPWIAIEFVAGAPIDAYCAARALPAAAIVGLLVQLADAVSAAHRMLVVHSDIKPSNVLVDRDGRPKLIDFGIATALRDAGVGGDATASVGRLFSPGYAAPEQINGEQVTVATDVFGLGALAYRLLAGRAPHAEASGPIAYLLAITQCEVAPASRTALAAGATAALARALRGDLDAILAKALERDPARRYPSVAELREDLQRYLERRPVLARAPSAGYRISRFVRRNALAVGLSGLLAASLVAGGVIAALQAHQAALAGAMAARRGEFLESLLKSADPRGGRRDISVAELLDSAAAGLDAKLGGEPLVEASMLGLIAETNTGLGRYPQGLAANERQLRLLRERGGGALEIARALAMRGELLREQGEWQQAEAVMREAVAALRPLRAPADLGDALNLLGIVLAHTYQERDALASFHEAIALELQGGRDLQSHLIQPYFSLAVTLADLGRYAESADYGRRAFELARRTLPADHPDLFFMEATYASTLINSARSAAAEPLLREALAASTRVLGAGHKDTLLVQLYLIDALLELGRYAQAQELAESTGRALARLLGPDNMYALNAWYFYGVAACGNNQVSAGLAAIEQVYQARRRLYPASDWRIPGSRVGVGLCLIDAHRYAQAEPELLQAAASLETLAGAGFRRTQIAYRALRELYLATGRPADAARYAARLRDAAATAPRSVLD